MAYRDLRDFIHKLEKHDELKRISPEVDPILEITEISDRAVKAQGPALLFEHPKNSKIPVITNLVGTERRMCMALEVNSLEEVAARISSFLDLQSPQGLLEKVKMLPKLAEIGSFFPKTVRSGDCQEVVRTDDFSLDHLPILKCWPQDGGRYITWPMVITKNPENGKRNVGCYRMQVYDSRTTGMHWQTQKHGADHYRSSRAKNPEWQTRSRRCHRRRPSHRAGRHSSRPARYGRVHVLRLPAQRPCGPRRLQNGGSRSPGQRRNRPRRLRRNRRDAHRRALRRPHRLLLPRRPISRLPHTMRHPSQRSSVSHHHRRPSSAGRLFHGPRHRARSSCP